MYFKYTIFFEILQVSDQSLFIAPFWLMCFLYFCHMPAQLQTLLQGLAPLAKDELEDIMSAFQPLYLKKGDYFFQSGCIHTRLGFIVKGLVRYFVFKNNEEATFEFTAEGEFVGDYQSFTAHNVSLQNIQAIENTELLIIERSSVQRIFNESPHGNLIGRAIIEHRFEVMVNQLLSIYMHSPKERYERFVKHYAHLNQRIPQYLVASYVGIQPQSLSRMRRKFAKQGR